MPNNLSHFMVYSGVHFKTCPIEFRELWTQISNPQAVAHAILKVTNLNIEFVNIGTCNRYDICFFGQISKLEIFEIFNELAEKKLPLEQLKKFIQIHFDFNAQRHLLHVTASLDSLIIGDQQIFGQIKSAYTECLNLGFAKKNAHKIFVHNFRVVKKIRTQTEIGKNSVSIGHAAIKVVRQVFNSLKDKRILIIGAGRMAKIIIKNCLENGASYIDVSNRTYENAEKLTQEIPFTNPQHLNSSLKNIHLYDICFVAIGGNELIITPHILHNYYKRRDGNLTAFIDISVPRKITPLAHDIENIYLFYVDDLDKVMSKNKEMRKKSALEAAQIIENEINAYKLECLEKENLEKVAKLHQWVKKIVQYEVERYLYDSARGKKKPSHVVAQSVSKRIISHMASLSRSNRKIANSELSVSDMLEFLFKISSQKDNEFQKYIQPENIIPFKLKKGH